MSRFFVGTNITFKQNNKLQKWYLNTSLPFFQLFIETFIFNFEKAIVNHIFSFITLESITINNYQHKV